MNSFPSKVALVMTVPSPRSSGSWTVKRPYVRPAESSSGNRMYDGFSPNSEILSRRISTNLLGDITRDLQNGVSLGIALNYVRNTAYHAIQSCQLLTGRGSPVSTRSSLVVISRYPRRVVKPHCAIWRISYTFLHTLLRLAQKLGFGRARPTRDRAGRVIIK